MLRRTAQEERGAVAVEFALVLPILIVILFGIIEYGSVFNAQVLVTGAAREAAREISVGQTVAVAQTTAIQAAPGLAPALSAGDVTFSRTSCAIGGEVEVTVDYEKPFLTGLFGATIDIQGVATRRCGG